MNTSPVRKMTGHLRNGQNMRVGVVPDKLSGVAKIFVIYLCCYAFDIAFSLFIYQIENTNICITLLKWGWSLSAQEDWTALYMFGKAPSVLRPMLSSVEGFAVSSGG